MLILAATRNARAQVNAVAQPIIVVEDSFSEAGLGSPSPDVPLQSHTPDIGTSWTLRSATGTAATGAIVVAATDKLRAVADDASDRLVYTAQPGPGIADYFVEVSVQGATVSLGSGDAFGLLLRYADLSNLYGCKMVDQATGTEIWLYKIVAGTVTLLASGDVGIHELLDAGFTLKLEAIGSALAVYVNGVLALSATDGSITAAGEGGLYWGELFVSNDDVDDNYNIDNFRLVTVPA